MASVSVSRSYAKRVLGAKILTLPGLWDQERWFLGLF